MAQTPEGKVKAKCKNLLNEYDAWHFLPVSNGMGVHGIPDIIACVPIVITPDMVGKTIGQFVGIETKAGSKTEATPRQLLQLKKINKAKGIGILINEDRVANLRKWLEKHCVKEDD